MRKRRVQRGNEITIIAVRKRVKLIIDLFFVFLLLVFLLSTIECSCFRVTSCPRLRTGPGSWSRGRPARGGSSWPWCSSSPSPPSSSTSSTPPGERLMMFIMHKLLLWVSHSRLIFSRPQYECYPFCPALSGIKIGIQKTYGSREREKKKFRNVFLI